MNSKRKKKNLNSMANACKLVAQLESTMFVATEKFGVGLNVAASVVIDATSSGSDIYAISMEVGVSGVLPNSSGVHHIEQDFDLS
jgi:hypothetical protein